VKNYTIPAQSRVTVAVDFEDPRLDNTPVSAIVNSTNNVPVIAERAMWWPSPNWYEAHLSAGATTTGTKWALAEDFVTNSTVIDTDTYILIANTSNTPGTVDVTVYNSGQAPLTRTFDLPANSRRTLQMSAEFPDGRARNYFSTVIQSSGPP